MNSECTKNRPTVVILDDEPFIRELMKEVLSREIDAEIIDCDHSETALEIMRKQPVSLLLQDISRWEERRGIKDYGGWELCRRMKADTDLRGVPILICSGYQESLNEEQRSLIEDFVCKGDGVEKLIASVRNILSRK